MSQKISKAARRYLLTGESEPYAIGYQSNREFVGGRWACDVGTHPQSVPDVRHFSTPQGRDAWVAVAPSQRLAVGKRFPAVKAHRRRVSGRTS